MENKHSKFGRFVINVEAYREILDILNKEKNLTARNVLKKLENLETHKFSHIVEWETIDFTVTAKRDIIFRGTLLHVTAALGYKRIVIALLASGADIEAKCSKGFTPLHYAVKYDQVELVELLLAEKANIHAVDQKGCTPLHLAAAKSSPEVAKVLLQAGAEVNMKDKHGNTPLHFAVNGYAKENIIEMVKILVHFWAEVNAKDQQGNTVLHRTILKKDNITVLEGLLTDYEETEDRFEKIAMLNEDEDTDKVVEFLLAHGAIAEVRNNSGDTVLHCAIMFSSFRVIKLLIRYGADVNARDSRSQAPLCRLQGRHLYDETEISDIVYILLKNGSDIDATDNRGVSTLEAIIRSGGFSLAKIVIMWVVGENPERNKPIYLGNYDCLSSYWDIISEEVKKELESLRTSPGHRKALFDFVYNKNANKLATYMENPHVYLIIESGEFRNCFPWHAHKILEQYHKGIKRLELLNMAIKSISKLYLLITNSSEILPEEVARKIALHLTNKDIKSLDAAVGYVYCDQKE